MMYCVNEALFKEGIAKMRYWENEELRKLGIA